MRKDQLDSVMVTALEALTMFVTRPRKVQNGEVVIVLGAHNPRMEDEQMWRIVEAKEALEKNPELATLLEIRFLEMQQYDAQKRLSKLRGQNG